MSGPDPSKIPSTAAGLLREQPDESKFEADLAELASRFAAQGGGGLSPELSAELALEIVLNEIVEQACLATGATGAAIVLERNGEMLCRASSGPTAPELGSRIDTTSGLSGECFKTGQTQWCDDVRQNSRADVEACDSLGVRSVVVMPLLRGTELVGVIELFSARPYAFGVRDERTLEVLADRTLRNVDHAARPLELQQPAEKQESIPAEATAPATVPSGEDPKQGTQNDVRSDDDWMRSAEPLEFVERGRFSYQEAFPEPSIEDNQGKRLVEPPTIAFGIAALACAVLVGVLMGRHWGTDPTPDTQVASTAYAAETKPVQPAQRAPAVAKSAAANSTAAAPGKSQVPPGGLSVFQSGKEVFRMAPNQDGSMEPASAVEPETVTVVPPATVESRIVKRVEPQYPEAAREQNIQGPVVLEVHMGTDGGVQDVQVVSGQHLLAQAAVDAVKQWKFKPQVVNGKPVEMQTRITLNFRLPI